MTYPNGIETSYAFDDAGQLLQILHQRTADQTAVAFADYTYDEAGNRVTMKDRPGEMVHTYGYDDLHRLITASHPHDSEVETKNETFSYDAVGNREADANIVVGTVAVNLRNCAPFVSLNRPDLAKTEKAEWDAAYQAGIVHEESAAFAEAVEHYNAAAKIDNQFAALHYRLGRCFLRLKKMAEADKHFSLPPSRKRSSGDARHAPRISTDTPRLHVWMPTCKLFRKNVN